VHRPDVLAAVKKCSGIFMPSPSQGLDAKYHHLGAKGVVELELISSGEKWPGPRKDVHSSNKARLDSPAWHLVEALATLVAPMATILLSKASLQSPPVPRRKKMIAKPHRLSEATPRNCRS